MRKFVLGLVAGTSLALGSAANAAITITACDPALSSCSFSNVGTQSTIAFDNSNVPAGGFSSFIDFVNTSAGLYSIVVESSTSGFLFSNVSISGSGGSIIYAGPAKQVLGPLTGNLGSGTFRFAFSGTSPPPNGGAASGNITFNLAPVPEPATWALMLLGFAGIGFAVRRSRRPALAQLA